jgi:uncharacterized membrane protein YhaH (DUF805 family)
MASAPLKLAGRSPADILGGMGTRPDFLNPNGRSGRVWFFVAASGLAVFELAERLTDASALKQGFGIAGAVYSLWFLFTALPRRAHDVGHTAIAFWLIYLVLGLPFLLIYFLSGSGAVPVWMTGALTWGLIFVLLLIWPGKPDENQWGPARGKEPSPQPA